MSGEAEVKVLRATAERTKQKQCELLKWLDRLIEENKPVEKEKRYEFIALVADACLGEGAQISIADRQAFSELGSYDWGIDGPGRKVDPKSAADVMRYAAYVEDEYLTVKGKSEKLPISDLWAMVRALAVRVFPFALRTAVRTSIERIPKDELVPRRGW